MAVFLAHYHRSIMKKWRFIATWKKIKRHSFTCTKTIHIKVGIWDDNQNPITCIRETGITIHALQNSNHEYESDRPQNAFSQVGGGQTWLTESDEVKPIRLQLIESLNRFDWVTVGLSNLKLSKLAIKPPKSCHFCSFSKSFYVRFILVLAKFSRAGSNSLLFYLAKIFSKLNLVILLCMCVFLWMTEWLAQWDIIPPSSFKFHGETSLARCDKALMESRLLVSHNFLVYLAYGLLNILFVL